MSLTLAGLCAPEARANPFTVTLTQQGGNVIATGNGSLDISGLKLYGSGAPTDSMDPTFSDIILGASAADSYAVTFLADEGLGFGIGGTSYASAAAGDTVGLFTLTNSQGQYTEPLIGLLIVPANYVSDSALSDSATWDDSTFASLGVTPGTYRLAWGSDMDQGITLDVLEAPPVAEPSSIGLLASGLLAIGIVILRRRRPSFSP